MFLCIGPYSPFYLKLMSRPILNPFTVVSLMGITIPTCVSWPHQCVGNAWLWVQFPVFDTCMQIVPVCYVLMPLILFLDC